jgi:hypothetical protein
VLCQICTIHPCRKTGKESSLSMWLRHEEDDVTVGISIILTQAVAFIMNGAEPRAGLSAHVVECGLRTDGQPAPTTPPILREIQMFDLRTLPAGVNSTHIYVIDATG